MPEARFSINNSTKGKPPRLPFASMKDAVLGKKYTLSVNFIGSRASRDLNRRYRGKDTATDILSFPLDNEEGEIYIDLGSSKKEAKKFGREFENFIAFLFIHGLLHLKGHDHGSTMESIERKFRKKFGI